MVVIPIMGFPIPIPCNISQNGSDTNYGIYVSLEVLKYQVSV